MKFWVIAYKYEEDVFWDFAKGDETSDLNESCFLPTKEMAEQFIEDELTTNHVAVELTLERLEKNGVWSSMLGRVEEWDSQYEEDTE